MGRGESQERVAFCAALRRGLAHFARDFGHNPASVSGWVQRSKPKTAFFMKASMRIFKFNAGSTDSLRPR